MMISVLPTLVVRKILLYLPPSDRLHAVDAFPVWEENLQSPSAWIWFRMDNIYDSSDKYRDEEISGNKAKWANFRRDTEAARQCIERYGQFVQNCTIQLTCPHEKNSVDCDLMDAIARHCVDMKTLRIYSGIKRYSGGYEKQRQKFIRCLNRLMRKCIELRFLALYNLDFDFMMNSVRWGVDVTDMREEVDLDLAAKTIQELEFYGPISNYSFNSSNSAFRLMPFCNLTKLQCDVRAVSTTAVVSLKHLRQLFLEMHWYVPVYGFLEYLKLKWERVEAFNPELEVHYLFTTEVGLNEDTMIPNPVAHSVIISKQCRHVCVSDQVIDDIVRCYGGSLRQFVQLRPSTDKKCSETKLYSSLANKCHNLHTFLLSCPITATGLVLIATNRHVKNIWVERHSIRFSRYPLEHDDENDLEDIEDQYCAECLEIRAGRITSKCLIKLRH